MDWPQVERSAKETEGDKLVGMVRLGVWVWVNKTTKNI